MPTTPTTGALAPLTFRLHVSSTWWTVEVTDEGLSYAPGCYVIAEDDTGLIRTVIKIDLVDGAPVDAANPRTWQLLSEILDALSRLYR